MTGRAKIAVQHAGTALISPAGACRRLWSLLRFLLVLCCLFAAGFMGAYAGTMAGGGSGKEAGALECAEAPARSALPMPPVSPQPEYLTLTLYDLLEAQCRLGVANKNYGDAGGDAYFSLQTMMAAALCKACRAEGAVCSTFQAQEICLNREQGGTQAQVVRKIEVSAWPARLPVTGSCSCPCPRPCPCPCPCAGRGLGLW